MSSLTISSTEVPSAIATQHAIMTASATSTANPLPISKHWYLKADGKPTPVVLLVPILMFLLVLIIITICAVKCCCCPQARRAREGRKRMAREMRVAKKVRGGYVPGGQKETRVRDGEVKHNESRASDDALPQYTPKLMG